jgi:hypothetical protein
VKTRQSDVYGLLIALASMGLIMLWRKKATKLPTIESSGAEGDAYARTNDKVAERALLRGQLAASWSQAYAAWANVSIGGLTLAAAVTAALVAVAAFRTSIAALTEAQKQSAEAHRQADAAEVQIGVAKDTAERQLRAYIVVSDTAVICPDCGDTARAPSTLPGISNFVDLRMENNGQTPAYNVSPIVNWWPVKEATKSAKLPPDFNFKDHKESADESHGVSFIGRDNHRDTYRAIGGEDISVFKVAVAAQSVIFLYGHIDYCDIFNLPHSTIFCFRYVPNSGTLHLSCDRHNGEAKPQHKCNNDATR